MLRWTHSVYATLTATFIAGTLLSSLQPTVTIAFPVNTVPLSLRVHFLCIYVNLLSHTVMYSILCYMLRHDPGEGHFVPMCTSYVCRGMTIKKNTGLDLILDIKLSKRSLFPAAHSGTQDKSHQIKCSMTPPFA